MEGICMYVHMNVMARVLFVYVKVWVLTMIQFNRNVKTYQQLVKTDFKAQGSILKVISWNDGIVCDFT